MGISDPVKIIGSYLIQTIGWNIVAQRSERVEDFLLCHVWSNCRYKVLTKWLNFSVLLQQSSR